MGHLEPVSMNGKKFLIIQLTILCMFILGKFPRQKPKRNNETYSLLSPYISPSGEMNL